MTLRRAALLFAILAAAGIAAAGDGVALAQWLEAGFVAAFVDAGNAFAGCF